MPLHAPKVAPSKTHSRNVRQVLLSYNNGAAYSNNEPTIIPFLQTSSMFDEAWGHSPPQIDQSTIFRLVLQNPNGIKLRKGFQVPLQDLQTCRQFGITALSLPKTNSDWSLPHQRSQLHRALRSTWSNSVSQVSHADETFLSSYQPGGTATIVCSRWATRVIDKGQDHLGMGRWSYITLRGKQNKKVTIVTVYNCGYSTGLKTACQQQTRILSKLFRNNNLPGTPNPHRQFILDMQSWLSYLISLEHEILLALDANEAYNPDTPGTVSPLTYTPGVPSYSRTHDRKFSTLVASRNLLDLMSYQHPEWPFSSSHIRGLNRIDYILVTPGLRTAVLRTGSLPYYSLFHGDHRPYYINQTAKKMFSDHTHEIHKPTGRALRLMDPRVFVKYRETLHNDLQYHKIHKKCESLQKASRDGT